MVVSFDNPAGLRRSDALVIAPPKSAAPARGLGAHRADLFAEDVL